MYTNYAGKYNVTVQELQLLAIWANSHELRSLLELQASQLKVSYS